VVGHQEATGRGVAGAPLASRPIRGINWPAIFSLRPELTPPGYAEVAAIMRAKRNPAHPGA
jgi:hypothetical protein